MTEKYYIVYFPQGLVFYETKEDLENDNWYRSTAFLQVKEEHRAQELLRKYNGSHYEEITKRGDMKLVTYRYVSDILDDQSGTNIWETFIKFPENKIIGDIK